MLNPLFRRESFTILYDGDLLRDTLNHFSLPVPHTEPPRLIRLKDTYIYMFRFMKLYNVRKSPVYVSSEYFIYWIEDIDKKKTTHNSAL